MATDAVSETEGIKFKPVPERKYLTLPYPKRDTGKFQRGMHYHRHVAKFYRWMSANDIPFTPAEQMLFEFEEATGYKPYTLDPIRTFIQIMDKR
jgi:hypothetical protein